MGPYLLSLELSTISHGLYQQMKFGLQLLMNKTVRLFCLRIVIIDNNFHSRSTYSLLLELLTHITWSSSADRGRHAAESWKKESEP